MKTRIINYNGLRIKYNDSKMENVFEDIYRFTFLLDKKVVLKFDDEVQ